MKTVIISVASSILLGVTIANAQQDTTNTGINTPRPANTQQPQYPQPQYPQPQYPQPQQNQQDPQRPAQFRRDDMIVIPQDQLPESLRETLRGTSYKGWEQSTIYQDPTTGEYLLDLRTTGTPATNNTNSNVNQNNTGNNNSLQTYRFDRYGRVIKDKNKTGVDGDQ